MKTVSPRPLKQRLYLSLFTFIGKILINLLGRTMKFKEIGVISSHPSRKSFHNAVYAFWHSRMLMSVYFFKNCHMNVLVSMSRDGELITRVIAKFGFGAVRGSVSRGGVKALREMLQVLEDLKPMAITPDGPKGPREKAQPGIVFLASQSQVPIIPFSFGASRSIRFKSWDRFMLPLPFSRGIFVWGNPISVPPNATPAQLETKRKELENELHRVTKISDEYFKKERKENEDNES